MGMKKGVNALTKTARIGSALIAAACVVGAAVNYRDGGEILLVYAAIIAIPAWVAAWILDSFVE